MRVITDYEVKCWLSHRGPEWLANHFGVRPATARKWFQPAMKIPKYVREEVHFCIGEKERTENKPISLDTKIENVYTPIEKESLDVQDTNRDDQYAAFVEWDTHSDRYVYVGTFTDLDLALEAVVKAYNGIRLESVEDHDIIAFGGYFFLQTNEYIGIYRKVQLNEEVLVL